MMRKLIATLAGLGVAIIAALFVPGVANASPILDKGIGGQFCGDHHGQYKLDNGQWYLCMNKNGWRWEPTTSPVPTQPSVTTSPATGGLPVIGTKEDIIAASGATAVLVGVGAVVIGRRRRKIRFTA